MPDKKYDWADMKAKYETGGYTYPMLAEEYGGNAKYIARKAKKQGWEKGKRRETVEKEAAKKVLDYQSTTEAELRNEFAKIFKLLRTKTIEEVMTMYEETGNILNLNIEKDVLEAKLNSLAKSSEDRLKAMRAATHVVNNCRQNEWEIYEIQEVAKKLEQDINANVNDIDFSDITTEDLKKMIHDEEEG